MINDLLFRGGRCNRGVKTEKADCITPYGVCDDGKSGDRHDKSRIQLRNPAYNYTVINSVSFLYKVLRLVSVKASRFLR